MAWLQECFTDEPTAPRRLSFQCRPALVQLEDRVAPTVSSISAGFNRAAIAAGSTIWFNSVFHVHGLAGEATIRVDGGTITSSHFNVDVPDAVISFSATAEHASTTFDA